MNLGIGITAVDMSKEAGIPNVARNTCRSAFGKHVERVEGWGWLVC